MLLVMRASAAALLLLVACGTEQQSTPDGGGPFDHYIGWAGSVQSAKAGAFQARIGIATDGRTFFGSFVPGGNGIQGLTGGISGDVIDGGYLITITPTACGGSFPGTAAVDGGVLSLNYSGSSDCFGSDHGTGVLPLDYDHDFSL